MRHPHVPVARPLDRHLHEPDGLSPGPLLHLQRHGQRLPPRRGHLGPVPEVRAGGQGQGRHLPRLDVRPGRPQREPHGAQRPVTAGDDRQGGSGGADDAAGVNVLGVPRYRHLAGRPHRGGRREEGPDQDAAARATYDFHREVEHRPSGRRRGHGRHDEVHHAGDVRRVLHQSARQPAQSALGSPRLRGLLCDGGLMLQV
mmetsp:Transcript_19784/g.57394  ORF Transcript_19784/g.57394 Transcript_19784/m.57394 type:complete len:200 (-) Transcript_19784:697-1296(-)